MTKYLADTGYSAWYYTARMIANPSITWGSNERKYDLQFNGCAAGQQGCYFWNQVGRSSGPVMDLAHVWPIRGQSGTALYLSCGLLTLKPVA